MNGKDHRVVDSGDFFTAEELEKRLSISTAVFRNSRPIGKDTLEDLRLCGIRRIEIIEDPEQYDLADAHSMLVIGDLCRSCGIEVIAYHAHKTDFSDLDTEAKRRRRVDRCRRQIDTMLDLGGVVWGTHAREADPTLVKCYRELARHVENTAAIISVENFPRSEMSVEDRMVFLDEIDHPQVGLILDIGHVKTLDGRNSMTIPGGPTEVIEACANHLIHVHLHGFKNDKDHFPPFVEGDRIQWIELFRMLHAKGYAGYMNFEPLGGNPTIQDALRAVGSAPEQIVKMNAQM